MLYIITSKCRQLGNLHVPTKHAPFLVDRNLGFKPKKHWFDVMRLMLFSAVYGWELANNFCFMKHTCEISMMTLSIKVRKDTQTGLRSLSVIGQPIVSKSWQSGESAMCTSCGTYLQVGSSWCVLRPARIPRDPVVVPPWQRWSSDQRTRSRNLFEWHHPARGLWYPSSHHALNRNSDTYWSIEVPNHVHVAYFDIIVVPFR